MSQAPQAPTRPSPMMLMETAWSFTRTQVLKTAVELDLFTQVNNGHRTSESLAKVVGATERGVRMVLNALAGLKILEKAGEQYHLTEPARLFLSKNSPGYLGHFLLHVDQIMPAWSHLTEVIRTGQPYARVEKGEDEAEFFTKLVGGLFAMNWPGAQAAAKALVGERQGLRILDIGAGSGVWGIAFAHQDPQARVTIADYPPVIDVARRFVAEHGLTDRFDYLPGNFREVDFGRGQYDLAILGHICHSEGERNTRELFRRIKRALKPDGRLLIAEFLADEERKGAVFPLLFAVNMLVSTEEGDTFTVPEMKQWLQETGFGPVDFIEGPTPSPLMVAKAAADQRDRQAA